MLVGGRVRPSLLPSLPAVFVILSGLLAPGCSNQTLIQSPKGSADAETARFEPIRDIPIPAGSSLDNDRSLILSNDKEWTGRLVLKADPPMPKLFAYYAQQMRSFGWQPVASIMGETSVLTFVQGQRAATVQIRPATLMGSVVTVTMAPRHGDTMAADPMAPDRAIQTDQLPPSGTTRR
jgi:hypothetical protein